MRKNDKGQRNEQMSPLFTPFVHPRLWPGRMYRQFAISYG